MPAQHRRKLTIPQARSTRGAAAGRAGDDGRAACVVDSGRDRDCALAELTDALLETGEEAAAVIVAATAGCSEGFCWVGALAPARSGAGDLAARRAV